MKLTRGQITGTLELHSVEWREHNGVIQAYEVSTMKGHDGIVRDSSRWVKAPTTQWGLARWLGY